MQRYEIILWDVDQTLLDFTRSEDYALRNTFEQFGRQIDSELTGGRGIPALGFGMTFVDTDKAAKYTLDENNFVEMKEKGAYGNSLFVKLSRETITEDSVEVGKIYTVHIGKDSGGSDRGVQPRSSTGKASSICGI